jgi:pimeloyl-ACP methyl ester carboxylesterase
MRSRKYYLVTIVILFLLVSNQHAALSQITPGVITMHEANSTIVYDWFTYVPTNLSKSEPAYILIDTSHKTSFDYSYDEATYARQHAEWRKSLAEQHKYVLLVPAIPRTPEYYTVAFQKECFLDSAELFYQRPNEKVNLMIDECIRTLEQDGYNVQEKVFVWGFSAGGMWANRYSLLHPERVRAFAAGQAGGALTLPESRYNATPMDWPIGVNDFLFLVGSSFNQNAYKEVPQFIYIGDQDTNTTLWGPGELWTQSQIDFIKATFGDTPPAILENQCDYLRALGYDITFRLYSGVGHEITSDMDNDVFEFFAQYRDSNDNSGNVFTDVPSAHWASDYINAIKEAGITTGYGDGTYGPEDPVSRDQMAVFIIRALYGETVTYSPTPYFTDVPSSHWAFKYIQKLKELGITTGCGSGQYCPEETVTRDQMAAFLVRARAGEDFICSPEPYFSDVPSNYWAFDYIQKLKELGITTGYGDGSYGPGDSVTRDQMAAFLYRAFLQ